MNPLLLLVLLLSSPQSAAEFVSQAQAKEKAGDPDGAIADFSRAITLDPKNAEIYGLRAAVKKTKGDTVGALADYTLVLELGSRDAAAYFRRGSVRVELRSYGGAIQDFSQAIELDPGNSHLYHFRGCLFYDAGYFNSAAIDFKKAVDLEAGSWEFPRLRLWLSRAKMGERAQASAELRKYLAGRVAPEGADPLGRALHFLAEDLAADAFWGGVESDQSEGAARWRCQASFLLGERAQLDGDKTAAIRHFENALATKATAWRDYLSAQVALEKLRGGK